MLCPCQLASLRRIYATAPLTLLSRPCVGWAGNISESASLVEGPGLIGRPFGEKSTLPSGSVNSSAHAVESTCWHRLGGLGSSSRSPSLLHLPALLPQLRESRQRLASDYPPHLTEDGNWRTSPAPVWIGSGPRSRPCPSRPYSSDTRASSRARHHPLQDCGASPHTPGTSTRTLESQTL
jgi:hypothetical protein